MGSTFVVDALTTETWLTMRPDGSQSDRIVSSWKWDEPHTTLELKLRNDVFFHDGSQMTSDVGVKALQKSVIDQIAYSFSSIKSITAKGPDLIEVRLSEPNSFFIPDLSLTSVRLPEHPEIGTGPFQVVTSDEQNTGLKANPKYYRGRPGVDQIEVNSYPTQRNAWAAMMRGEIDMLHEVSREAAEFVQAETTVQTYSFPRPYYIPLVFNVRHPILRQVEVRRAINEAIDRVALVRDGMAGHGAPADGPVWPLHWAYSTPRPFPFDPDAARHRLDRAGLTMRTATPRAAPMRFSFTCLVFANDARFERLAVLIQKELADVGIDMRLEPLKQGQLLPRISSGDFDAFVFEMAGRSLSWVYEFWRSHDGSMNNTGYTSADPVLDQLRAARTDDQVRAGVEALVRIMHDDPPAAFLAWQETSRAVSKNFEVMPEKQRDIFANIWQWHLAGPAKQAAR